MKFAIPVEGLIVCTHQALYIYIYIYIVEQRNIHYILSGERQRRSHFTLTIYIYIIIQLYAKTRFSAVYSDI